jgi:hypothetical protein
VAGVYLVELEGTTSWVTAPTYERLERRGIQALEGYTWPSSGRHLRPWYELIREARADLLVAGGPALGAVKDMCREGLGRMASKARTVPQGRTLADDPTYQPYWAWAVIAEVRERLMARVDALAELSRPVVPVAIDTDCLYFLSSRRSPGQLAVALGLPLGSGLGQFKPAGSCTAAEAREALADDRTPRAVAALREVVR